MKVISRKELDCLSQAAGNSSRRRLNLNLHEHASDPCQRLFNALEPGTYVRPHRHLEAFRNESFVAVRGRMALIVFEDTGDIRRVVTFGEGSETIAEVYSQKNRGGWSDIVAIDLPSGLWHTIVSLAPGSIFFEVKTGPYDPLTDKSFAPWAPEEDSPQADAYLASLLAMVSQDG